MTRFVSEAIKPLRDEAGLDSSALAEGRPALPGGFRWRGKDRTVREVLVRALHHNAAAVIFGHNHPSGISEPSEADRGITLKLGRALALVDIRLLDHLVVTRDGHVSLAERGWI